MKERFDFFSLIGDKNYNNVKQTPLGRVNKTTNPAGGEGARSLGHQKEKNVIENQDKENKDKKDREIDKIKVVNIVSGLFLSDIMSGEINKRDIAKLDSDKKIYCFNLINNEWRKLEEIRKEKFKEEGSGYSVKYEEYEKILKDVEKVEEIRDSFYNNTLSGEERELLKTKKEEIIRRAEEKIYEDFLSDIMSGEINKRDIAKLDSDKKIYCFNLINNEWRKLEEIRKEKFKEEGSGYSVKYEEYEKILKDVEKVEEIRDSFYNILSDDERRRFETEKVEIVEKSEKGIQQKKEVATAAAEEETVEATKTPVKKIAEEERRKKQQARVLHLPRALEKVRDGETRELTAEEETCLLDAFEKAKEVWYNRIMRKHGGFSPDEKQQQILEQLIQNILGIREDELENLENIESRISKKQKLTSKEKDITIRLLSKQLQKIEQLKQKQVEKIERVTQKMGDNFLYNEVWKTIPIEEREKYGLGNITTREKFLRQIRKNPTLMQLLSEKNNYVFNYIIILEKLQTGDITKLSYKEKTLYLFFLNKDKEIKRDVERDKEVQEIEEVIKLVKDTFSGEEKNDVEETLKDEKKIAKISKMLRTVQMVKWAEVILGGNFDTSIVEKLNVNPEKLNKMMRTFKQGFEKESKEVFNLAPILALIAESGLNPDKFRKKVSKLEKKLEGVTSSLERTKIIYREFNKGKVREIWESICDKKVFGKESAKYGAEAGLLGLMMFAALLNKLFYWLDLAAAKIEIPKIKKEKKEE
jgi:hypothetical protein